MRARGERRGVWGARRVLTRAHTRREGERGGCVPFGAYNPHPGNKGGVALTPLFFAVRGAGLAPAGRVLAWAGVTCACGRVGW